MPGVFWVFLFFVFKDLIFRKRERERGEKCLCEREALMGCLSHAPQPGTGLTTQARVLTGDQTSDLSLCGKTPNQLSYTCQGSLFQESGW